MDTQGFLTKWTIIGFLIGAAYFSHQTPTEQAKHEETEQSKAYRAARKKTLENRERAQREWQQNHPQEYYKIKNFKSHETISHGAQGVPHLNAIDPGNKRTRPTGRKNGKFQPYSIQGPRERKRNLVNAPKVRASELPWHYRDLQQLRDDRVKYFLHKNKHLMNSEMIKLKPPGRWEGNTLHTKSHSIRFDKVSEEQKKHALEELNNGNLAIRKTKKR